MVNIGVQNTPRAHGGGRSILDYSLFVCTALLLLLGLIVLDAFEYISVPGLGGAHGKAHTAIEASTGFDILSAEELEELQQKVEEAKKKLEEKTKEVEKIVDKVEEEIKEEEIANGEAVPAVETPEEKQEEKEKKEAEVKAIVDAQEKRKFCAGCRYGYMNFTCSQRKDFMMSNYGLTEDIAIEAIMYKCDGHWAGRHQFLRRRF